MSKKYNKTETRKISISYKMIAHDARVFADAIDKHVDAWEALPEEAERQQIVEVMAHHIKIQQAWEALVKNLNVQTQNVLFLLSGTSNKN